MPLSLKDRVKELTMTTGTGTLSLVSAQSGFRRFNSVLSDGDVTYYCIESGSQWEVGIGTYTANTLARTTVLASSNSNSLINIDRSRSYVFITYAADKAVYKDASNRTVIGSSGIIFSDLTVQTTAAVSPTTIVGISGTKAQFDTSVTDGNFLYVGDAPTSHAHGNITNAGAIGSTTGLPIVTTTSGVLTAGSFGTTAGTFAAGDDSRITGALSTSTAASTYAVIAAGQPISGTVGQVLAKNSGTNYDSSWISLVLGDRYLSTSTTSNTLSNTVKSFTIATGLAYTPTQNITIAYDATNHMHGEVVTYNSGTGALSVDVKNHTGTGTYTSWVVNVGGVTPATVVSWGDIIGTLGTQSDLSDALNAKLEITTAASTYLPLAGGTLTGDLKFTDATYDIGKSGATRPRDGFFSRNLTVGSSVYVNTYGGPSTPVISWGGGDFGLYASTFGVAFRAYGAAATVAATNGGLVVTSGSFIGWSSTSSVDGARDLSLFRDSAGIFAQRNGTNAQTLRVYNTYTSSTSFENLQFKANAGAAYQIGSAIGSAGGSNQAIEFGHWNAAGTWASQLSVLTTGVLYSTQASSAAVLQTAGGVIVYGTLVSTPHLSLNGWWTGTQSSNGGINFGSGQKLVWGSSSSNSTASGTSGDIGLARNAAGVLEVNTGTIGTLADLILSKATLTQAVSTSGSPTAFTITGAAHTTLTLSTEATDVNFNLARTVQFATGALTTQRAMRIQAPTYSFVGASTITTASTLSISGPPVAGTNATITNAYALEIENNGILALQNVSGYATGVPRIAIRLGSPYVGLGLSSFVVNGDGYCYSYAGFEASYLSPIGFQSMKFTFDGGWGNISRSSASLNGKGNHFTSAYNLGLIPAATYGVQVINGINAMKLQVYNTYTSSTSYETLNLKGKASANFEIGPENGSAGGTLRGLTIGGYTAGSSTITPWLTLTNTGAATLNSGTLVVSSGGTGIVTKQGNIYLDSFATHSGIRYRRSEGTEASPTAVALNSLLGFFATYGYHSGSAYHTTQGCAISFYATEAYTATAQGAKIVLGTTPNGTATLVTALTIDQNQVATFSKLVAQSAAEITSTPSGTTQTITLNDGNHQTLALTSATGTVTVTLTVPSNVSAGTIIVEQHATTVRDLTWAVSSGTIKWMGAQPTWSGDATSSVRIVSWRYDGSVMYLASTEVAV